MSLLSKIPVNNVLRTRRIPNAFMLFVKEQKQAMLKTYPLQEKVVVGAWYGKKWKSMKEEEKQVYYDKYNALKANMEISEDLHSTRNTRLLEKGASNSGTDSIPVDDLAPHSELKTRAHKRKKDEDVAIHSEEHAKTKKIVLEAASDGKNSEVSSEPNSKVRKIRRSPNAFVLFASEQRKNTTELVKRMANVQNGDKQNHICKILGAMWKELKPSAKEKYFTEARRLSALHKDAYSDFSFKSDASKSKKKYKSDPKMKKAIKKTLARKVKVSVLEQTVRKSDLQAEEAVGSATSEARAEADTETEMTVTREGTATNMPEVQSVSESSTMSLCAANSMSSSFHPMSVCSSMTSPFSHCRYASPSWWPDANNCGAPQYSAPDAGMNASHFGNGPFHSHASPYQLAEPNCCMYRPFGQHPYHFPSVMPYVHPYCKCYNPYYPCHGSYFGAYFADRFSAPYSNVSRPVSSTNSRNNESVTVESVSSSRNYDRKEDAVVIESVYSAEASCNRKENSIVIESVCSAVDNAGKDDDHSSDSHSLVIVDDEDDVEVRGNPGEKF